MDSGSWITLIVLNHEGTAAIQRYGWEARCEGQSLVLPKPPHFLGRKQVPTGPSHGPRARPEKQVDIVGERTDLGHQQAFSQLRSPSENASAFSTSATCQQFGCSAAKLVYPCSMDLRGNCKVTASTRTHNLPEFQHAALRSDGLTGSYTSLSSLQVSKVQEATRATQITQAEVVLKTMPLSSAKRPMRSTERLRGMLRTSGRLGSGEVQNSVLANSRSPSHAIIQASSGTFPLNEVLAGTAKPELRISLSTAPNSCHSEKGVA